MISKPRKGVILSDNFCILEAQMQRLIRKHAHVNMLMMWLAFQIGLYVKRHYKELIYSDLYYLASLKETCLDVLTDSSVVLFSRCSVCFKTYQIIKM